MDRIEAVKPGPKDWPSVTVVMPCYNAESTIGTAIDSVLSQRYRGEIEILVIDDGSSDDSVHIAGRRPRVRVLSQPNRGPAAARNLGLAHARGEVLAFLDADDLWTVDSLRSRVWLLMSDPELGVVFGNFSRWTPASGPNEIDIERPDQLPDWALQAVETGWIYPHILLDPIVHIIATVVRRSVVAAIGYFDAGLRTGEDYDFFIRAALHCRFGRVNRVVARYRIHAANITRVPQPSSNEYDVLTRAIERYGTSGPFGQVVDSRLLARRLQRLCFDHALLHLQTGDASIAARGFRAAIRHDPTRVKAWLFAALASVKARQRSLSAAVGPQ